ncbi:Protein O-mannosyltransferase 2 [Coemansia sp. Benny D115]|nr:Protein O-mannosyltransferase 2 [Coemansia sp. Benny D115]
MLIGLSELLAGHNGTFQFKGKYPDYVDYVFMRRFTALFGIALAPLAYVTCLQLGMRRRVCALAALFVVLDNALCVMSRFVLLDEALLCFTALSLCAVSGLQNARRQPFSTVWWRWLVLTGAALGCVVSSKWVGLLAIALVGLHTVEELLGFFAARMPPRLLARHIAARAACLIVVPMLIYALCFRVHFAILNRSGPGDATMPPAFQARLRGSPLARQPFGVVFGSTLNLRSMRAGSGLLHSHAHRYPGGSQQQQITCYGHKDSNNNWLIVKPAGGEFNYTTEPLLAVRNGDVVRLMHVGTGTMLHSHSEYMAPVTTDDLEVTGYGKREWDDPNNSWRFEVVREESTHADGQLHAITTQFRLRHLSTGCLLATSAARLPAWGFRQSEVSCRRGGGDDTDSAVVWVVERHINKRIKPVNMKHMVKPSFFGDFVRLNIEMARSNNALVPDRDKYNHLESDPWSWPLLIYPMRMLGSWKASEIKYYEIGNPLLWWASTLCCALFPLQLLYYRARSLRRLPSAWAPGEERWFWNAGRLLWGGWALHYFPFFLMGRVTYIHHYLPALYFALLLLAFEIDFCCRRLLPRAVQNATLAAWAIAALAVFFWFAPLTFGYAGDVTDLKHRQQSNSPQNLRSGILGMAEPHTQSLLHRRRPPTPQADSEEEPPKYSPHKHTHTAQAPQATNEHQGAGRFDNTDRILTIALTLACLFTRLYRIGRRGVVSWDETHFGKFGAYYINRTFYHDVHPPLAKMLVGLGEYLSGHNGSFEYKSAAVYPDDIHYTLQRAFVAVFGVLIVPLAYRTCRLLGFGQPAAVAGAAFVLFDNALCVISRFILLDPPLLCFTALALLAYSGFAAQRDRAFSGAWWRWLLFTGVALGLVVSSKWVGLFAVALVGLCTIEELLALYNDRRCGAAVQVRHWAARILCLIAVPLAIYVLSFQVHFALLNNRGTGDFKMPSAFQALQRNSVVANQPHDVSFGSNITLRSHLPGFGLVHANKTRRFPDYDHEIIAGGVAGKQPNNWWTIVSANFTWENASSPVVHIGDGQLVRLVHAPTKHFLRTGRNPPHHLGWDRRVFVGGNQTTPSVWDLWRVKIVSEESTAAAHLPSRRLHTVTTTFQLANAASNCLLMATATRLPEEWGRQMSELICTDANATRSETTLWNIEQVRDTRLKRVSFRHLVKRRLLRDTLWINREMALSNSRLLADPDRYKHTESSPWTWPLLLYPMRMVSWADSSVKYYEIGNPLLWWASSFCCLVLYPAQMIYWLIRYKARRSGRQGELPGGWQAGEFRRFWDTTKLLWGGWALHYLPFFLMGRVTYIHHYLPALYFALLLLAYELQCLAAWLLPQRMRLPVACAAVAAAAGVFWLFSPLTFGWDRPAKELARLCWLSTWNIYKDSNVF